MGILEILEYFLPDYHSNNDIARMDDLSRYIGYDMDADEQAEKGLYDTHYHQAFFEFLELQDKLVEKAIQNLTNRICEKQRKNCNNSIKKMGIFLSAINQYEEDLLSAEQPKIEDLITVYGTKM